MKEETLQVMPQKFKKKKIIKDCLKEMDKFLETYTLPRMTHE